MQFFTIPESVMRRADRRRHVIAPSDPGTPPVPRMANGKESAMSQPLRVTVWNEFRHEKEHEAVRKLYPDGMHAVIAKSLSADAGLAVRTATLDEPENGLSEEILAETDVLTWWGHKAHGEVLDEVVDRVQQHVLAGMGLIVLHSGHFSKIFRRLMGTNCSLKWREEAERERLWNLEPGHPITEGIGEYIELPNTEMYGERFDIPTPDKLIFLSWFEGGEVFRSGCVYERGHGRIFYFRPGHETYPIFYNEEVLRVINNAVRWAAPRVRTSTAGAPNSKPIETLSPKETDFGSAGIQQT
jgi:trehalose utilization protein